VALQCGYSQLRYRRRDDKPASSQGQNLLFFFQINLSFFTRIFVFDIENMGSRIRAFQQRQSILSRFSVGIGLYVFDGSGHSITHGFPFKKLVSGERIELPTSTMFARIASELFCVVNVATIT
jgi:hypothetical protein